MADVNADADVAGYQDGTTNWTTDARLYVTDDFGGDVNTIGLSFDASALEASDTITAAQLDWTWDTDHSISDGISLTFDAENAADPANFSGSNLPRDATLVGSTVTGPEQTSSPSGADSQDITSLIQALVSSQGAGNIGNLNLVVGASHATADQYLSLDGSPATNFTLTITTTSGTQTLTPDAVTVSSAAQGPTMNTGAVAVAPDPVELAAALQSPALGAVFTLTPDFVGVLAELPDPTINAGQVALTPDAVTFDAVAQSVTIDIGGVTLTPSVVVIANQLPDPTVVSGATLAPDAVAFAGAMQSPSLSPGAVVLTPAAMEATLGLSAPTMAAGGAALNADVVTINLDQPDPTLVSGGVLTPDVIALLGQIPGWTAAYVAPAAPTGRKTLVVNANARTLAFDNQKTLDCSGDWRELELNE